MLKKCFCNILIAAIAFFAMATAVHAAPKGGALQQWWQQCERARSLCNYDSLYIFSTSYYTRAREAENRRDEAYALFYKGLSQLFTGKSKEAYGTLQLSNNIADEIGQDSIRALVENAFGIYYAMAESNSFLAQQFFFRSLRYAEKAGYNQLKGRVYGNMLVLTQSANDSTGLSNARIIYQEGKNNNDYEQMFMGAYFLAMYHNIRGENTQAEVFLKESLKLHEKYRYDDVSAVYTLYSKVKLEQGRNSEALALAEKAVALARQYNQVGLLPDAYMQQALVVHHMGDYRLSKELAAEALRYAEEGASRSRRVECLRLMAENCRRLGQTTEALDYLQRANLAMDTLSRINMDRLMHERAIMLDMEQKEQEAELRKQQISSQKTLNIVLAVTTLLLLALLAVIVANYRRRNTLYKKIVMQNARSINRQKQMQNTIDRLQVQLDSAEKPTIEGDDSSKDTPSNKLLDDEERMQELYDHACVLMEQSQLYRDAQLNREKLAGMLGTNRTYLSRIIKEIGGMNYLQFVNSYRINEAVRILSDPEQTEYPLKQLWSDLGFNSATTFYKLFQKEVGITPSVYRKQFIDLNP